MHIVTDPGFWILLVSGLLTVTMVQAVFSPRRVVMSYFGDTLEGPSADIVIRNWAALITLVGAALVAGAILPEFRAPVLLFAGASKLVFIVLVMRYARRPLSRQAGMAIGADCVFILLYAYLLL